MPTKILMPALSPTMTEGKLAKWHKKEGDKVKSGEVLAEIETDKATMEVEAVDEGTLGRILVKDGTEGVAVNSPIALLLNEGEKASDLDAAEAEAKKAAPQPAPAPKAEAAPAPQPQAAPKPQAQPQAAPPAPRPAPAPAPQRASGERVFASPLARRIARDSGIDLAALTGSGPHGRIVRADVESAIASGGTRAVSGAVGGGVTAGLGKVFPPAQPELVPHSTMRKVIAKRLSESKQTVPHFYVDVDCEIDELLKVRAEINEMLPDAKISVNDFVVRAAALALMKVPEVNASWSEDGMKRYKSADISIAVAIEGGLITPIVRSADKKGVGAISVELI
jgi:pyruvate dehydrogenase E2 component (dihydrolipoamide acetyltransferase)